MSKPIHTSRQLRLPKGLAFAAGLVVFALVSALTAAGAKRGGGSTVTVPDHVGGVHGSVYVSGALSPAGIRAHIAMPGHRMQLRDKITDVLIAEADTDIYGRYYFPPQAFGTYRLKWVSQAGWRAGQHPDDVVIQQGSVSPEWVELRPLPRNVVAYGAIRQEDGTVPGIVDEFFGLEVTSDVSIRSGTGALLAGPVRANAEGTYAISARVPRRGASVTARIEGTTAEGLMAVGRDRRAEVNLALPNSAPSIVNLYLENAAGRGVRGGVGGEVLTTVDEIVDTDGDATEIEWKSEYASGEPNLTRQGRVVSWRLPSGAGGYSLYAVVSDGRGGYARGSVESTIDKQIELFTGMAVDRTTGEPIVQAEVEVNGRFTETNDDGFYSLQVPLAERYVLNIRDGDYAVAGRAFDTGNRGRTWQLVPRQRERFDPRQGITLIDRRQELGKRRGAQLTLPPDVLVDPQGNLPTGMLNASFATIDIGADESAGNYAALIETSTGPREVGLTSYGVLSIEVTDDQGQEYQIRQGAVAELAVPIAGVDAGEIPAGAPQSIGIWSYDEADGYWKPSGDAILDPATSTYVGTVNHFSEINVDAIGADTCIRVLVDPSLIGKYLRVSDVASDGLDYAAVVEGALDQALSVIYTIPPTQLCRLEVINGPGGSIVPGVVIERLDAANLAGGWDRLTGNEVLSGPISTPTFPAYPYSEAPITVLLKLEVPPGQSFLHYKGLGSSTIAQEYYDQVNPQVAGDGNRDTLQEWWAHNGFNTDGSVTTTGSELYARTSYLNDNDLGSGRDMHLYRREDGTAMAWVSNYGKFNQSHGNANLALFQTNLGELVATVCMEFSPMENAAGAYLDSGGTVFTPGDFGTLALYYAAVEDESVVKFFVFANADGVGGDELQESADLDKYGPKFVPNVCLNCHGGSPQTSYTSPSDCSISAHFRELDYATYKFPLGATTPSVPEKQAFRTQNDIVRGTNTSLISGAPIKELIDIWYRGGGLDIDQDECVPSGGGGFDPLSLPSGWNGSVLSQEMYCDVVGKSCRTCHIAFGSSPFSFNTSAFFEDGQFAETALDLFINATPSPGTMPHAVVTYRNFWTSELPFRPAAAQDWIDNN